MIVFANTRERRRLKQREIYKEITSRIATIVIKICMILISNLIHFSTHIIIIKVSLVTDKLKFQCQAEDQLLGIIGDRILKSGFDGGTMR